EVWIYAWQTRYAFWLLQQILTLPNTYAHPNIYSMSLQKNYHPAVHRSSTLSQGTPMASAVQLNSVSNLRRRQPGMLIHAVRCCRLSDTWSIHATQTRSAS